MIKVLFLIHDLGCGGAEKVLVNLVNHLDKTKFDVTMVSLFGGGVNEQFLNSDITYKTVFRKSFPGNSKVLKLFSPRFLHKCFIKDRYDIEVSYLEGPSARIISGCQDKDIKTLCWIHCTMQSKKEISTGFRSFAEATKCYQSLDNIVFVSQGTKNAFENLIPLNNKVIVKYNTNETEQILSLKDEDTEKDVFRQGEVKLCGVGKILPNKGFDRMARIHKRLKDEGYPVHFYALGVGSDREKIEAYLKENNIQDSFTFLGYQTNPYKYVSKCDIFVCASFAEGFSTAATEALIVGTPVVTTEVSGMKEMLGENNEYGIVTDNNEEALYNGIKTLLDNPNLLAHYKEQTKERGKFFSTENTVKAVEEMFEIL